MITNIIGAILGCSVDMVGILHPFNVLEFVLLRWFRCFNVQACTVVLPEKWGGAKSCHHQLAGTPPIVSW